jgi:glycosyltransferase 2 family protein
MPKKLITAIQIILFVGLGVFVVWYITKDFTPEQKQELYGSFRQARYIYLLPVTATLLLAHYIRALRWRILIQTLHHSPSRANTFFAVLLGYMFNLFVPRLGEVLKCTLLSRYERVPPDKLVGTIVAERAFDLVSLLTVILITFLVEADIAGPFLSSMLASIFQGKSGSFSWLRFVLILLGIVVVIILIIWLFKRYRERKFITAVRHIFANIYQGLMSFRHLRRQKAFLGYTVLMWVLYLLSIRIGFLAFTPVEHLHTPAALSTLTFGSLGMIAPTQNGLGPYQFAVQQTMELYGVGPVPSMAFGWILWGAQTAILLVFGTISLALLPLINRNKHEKTGTTTTENLHTGGPAEATA